MAGRPAKEINKQEFEKLLAIGCDKAMIIAWYSLKYDGFNQETLRAWIKRTYGEDATFTALAEQKKPLQKMAVLKGIHDMVGRNAAVTIFAAKNLLGWTDKVEQTISEGSHLNLEVNHIRSKLKDVVSDES